MDKGQRQDALLSVQSFAPMQGTPRDMDLEARRRAVITRPEVQAAIRQVGRVEVTRWRRNRGISTVGHRFQATRDSAGDWGC
jgi:hypothetical protein